MILPLGLSGSEKENIKEEEEKNKKGKNLSPSRHVLGRWEAQTYDPRTVQGSAGALNWRSPHVLNWRKAFSSQASGNPTDNLRAVSSLQSKQVSHVRTQQCNTADITEG